MSSIFICYRRDDSEGQAGRLYEDLARRYGKHRLYLDVDSKSKTFHIKRDASFHIQNCSVFLLLIGNQWLIRRPKATLPRIFDNEDLVRAEILEAMESGKTIFPILLGDCKMPDAKDLPLELSEITMLPAIELRHTRWPDDINQICEILELKNYSLKLSKYTSSLKIALIVIFLAIFSFFSKDYIFPSEPNVGPNKFPDGKSSLDPVKRNSQNAITGQIVYKVLDKEALSQLDVIAERFPDPKGVEVIIGVFRFASRLSKEERRQAGSSAELEIKLFLRNYGIDPSKIYIDSSDPASDLKDEDLLRNKSARIEIEGVGTKPDASGSNSRVKYTLSTMIYI